MTNRFVIHWKVIETGTVGHGLPISYNQAVAWRDKMNKEYKGVIEHWIEELAEPQPATERPEWMSNPINWLGYIEGSEDWVCMPTGVKKVFCL